MKGTRDCPFPDEAYVPVSIERITHSRGEGAKERNSSAYTLLAIERGEGRVRIGNRIVRLERGDCIVVAAHTEIEAKENHDEDLRLYLLCFEVMDLQRRGQDVRREAKLASLIFSLAEGEPKPLRPLPRLLQLLNRIYENRHTRDERVKFENYGCFQELMGLLPDAGRAVRESTSKDAVRHTIALMEQTYYEDITLQQLAQTAALSRRQYSMLFRELTGTSPMHYLADIRIARAREQLLLGEDRLHDISRSVGYRDPSYFSRRFKRATGIPPQVYIRRHRHEGRVVAIHYTGYLLALDITPVGVGSLQQSYHFRNRLGEVREVGFVPEAEAIAPLQPDLILGFVEGESHEKLSRIAPTYTISWGRFPWRDLLTRLGKFFGKERAADDWLERFHDKAERVALKFQSRVGVDQTVCQIWVWKNEIHVYRKHKVLYDILRLTPPEQIRNELRLELEGFKSIIQLQQLPDYASDRILLLVSGDPESRSHLKRIMESPNWNSLPAVRNGRVQLYPAEQWIPSDPLSIEAQLDEAERLLNARLFGS
ncbi:helix-turn-helix domain-containing protein [Paenibacillus hemerocallicola]|uniref:Helix-turn-helix domain-containing protein n=1 Tax=Paenibacillus hemerocallicola TaxID=1172614 RepID=A0A5C4SW79_9BACL|nr:helix-turn-helix domain-containing protein [Paenibacillus hemerocallicola]TNJ56100.1 helix-turn-helix domain-containing protein [Paenibacillus hemerocallicola]